MVVRYRLDNIDEDPKYPSIEKKSPWRKVFFAFNSFNIVSTRSTHSSVKLRFTVVVGNKVYFCRPVLKHCHATVVNSYWFMFKNRYALFYPTAKGKYSYHIYSNGKPSEPITMYVGCQHLKKKNWKNKSLSKIPISSYI